MDQGDYFNTVEDVDFEETNCEEVWNEEMARKDADLLQWLQEFKESDEYAEYLKRKKRRKNKKTQVNPDLIDAVEKCSALEEWLGKQGLYGRHKRDSKNKCKDVKVDQDTGINIIKEKIYEAKRKYYSQVNKKFNLEQNDRETIIKILKEEYGIDLPWLTSKSKLITRVICVRRKKREARERKRRNTLGIVEKLLGELKYEKAFKEKKEKVWDYKKSQGKFVEGLEIVGCKVTLHEPSEPEVVAEELEEEPEVIPVEEDLEKEEKKKSKKSKKGDKKVKKDKGSKKKDKKDKSSKTKGKKGSKDKKSKGKSNKKSKKDAKSKKEAKFTIPVPPMLNQRKKIEPENWEIAKLLKDMDMLQEYLDDKRAYEIEKLMQDRLTYEEDHQVQAIPSKIIFKNFINGHTYQMKVQVKNTSSFTKKLRFDKIIWNADIDDDLLLEVEPVGIQKIITGMNSSFYLRFNPETLQKSIEAKIVFLTYKPNTNVYRQYVMYVVCTPFCSEIVVSPTVILFDEMPIWRAKKLKKASGNYKILKIKNSGSKECKIVITKIHNPITVEHEWRNIISILSIDETSSHKITSSELSLEEVSDDRFPRNLVQECVENSFNNFRFDRMIFNVPGNSEKNIKVWFRNFDNSGFYVETYSLSVYERYPDDKLYCIGNQDLIVNAELSDHFLQLIPDLLDFEVCAYDSVYQLSFHIFNPSNLPHNVKIKLPSSLRGYLSCAISDITIQPGKYHRVHLKFTPRKDFAEYNHKFYDGENDLFEFPIYVVVYTRNFGDTPPLVIDVFAVLTNPMGLVLIPNFGQHISHLDNEYLVDLGQCGTNETVFTEFKIQNNSLVPQQYGFNDLPECIAIQPNFGFGYLQPMQTKTLRLYFQPTKHDLTNLPLDEYEPNTVLFNISANTVKNLGALKKRFDVKVLNNKLKQMEQIVKNPPKLNQPLEDDIQAMCNILRSNSDILFPEIATNTRSSTQYEEETTISLANTMNKATVSNAELSEKVLTVIQYDETSEVAMPSLANSEDFLEDEEFHARYPSNKIWLKATIKKPLCEFSYQYVMFPDTPCGSYSVASIELRFLHGMKNCWAKFEIFGNCDEITVEPNVGELKQGEVVNIYLIAKPEVPQHIIEEKAVALKIAEAIEAKRKELEMKRNVINVDKPKVKGSKKAKKGKHKPKVKKHSETDDTDITDNTNTETKVSLPEIIINEKDIVYGYFDYYPAEMCVWRNLEPYFIEADICCKISYRDENMEYSTEKIFLKAKCRVVQPNFIHDLNLQEIDFENVAIGMSRTKIVTLQNIQRRLISPKINPLNPEGCFSTSEFGKISIMPEFLLKIPITYTPQTEDDDKEDIEFFEIVSEQTTCPLILKGRGIFPLLSFKPEFTVSRIDSGAECTFEIRNDTECSVEINFTKTCELDGKINENPESITKKDKKTKKEEHGKKPKKKEKSSGSSKSKEVVKKRPKFSENLMDDEMYSLENFFENRKVQLPSLFRVVSGQTSGDIFEIPANGKSVFKIKFGLVKEDKDTKKKGKKEKKEKKKKEKSKSKEKKGKKTGKNVSYHVAKYVVTLGKREFLKEFLVVGCLNQ